ncbi:MAG: NAD(P)/FAD-dependent oxidoreductase [Saprospiraceae bacterium]|nr:NAD(P)/FAD-dependent oxidoreductase [Saprospiraceae bacterium]
MAISGASSATLVQNLIIGAGPAGLAVAGRLRQLGIPFEIIEKSDHVADAWRRHYDRLCLHTVKELSHLPGFPFPENYPRYVPRSKLVDYYEAYAKKYQIHPLTGQEVVHLRRKQGIWLVRTTKQDFRAANVVIATGANRVPVVPQWPGQEAYRGQLLHSSAYKNPAPWSDQKVLVVGMGNSGAEIALDLCENGVDVHLSVRGPVNIVPRDFLGNPTQKTALKLAKLPYWLGDRIGILLRSITIGDLSRFGIATPAMPPSKQLRLSGKTPVIDIGTVAKIKSGKIKVQPAVRSFTPEGVVFENGSSLPFDAVILATGYRSRLGDFIEYTQGLLDDYDLPRYTIGEGEFQGLFFVGFDNYTTGGVLGVINRDSAIIANAIATSGANWPEDEELPE